MADLELDGHGIAEVARMLTEAASGLRDRRALPMLQPASYTGAGPAIGGFMRATAVAVEAVSDAAGAAAATAAGLASGSADLEAEIARALGPGFVS